MSTSATARLKMLAQRLADALPAPVAEVVLTGSVSREVACSASPKPRKPHPRHALLTMSETIELARAA